jgi:hypothetical protein
VVCSACSLLTRRIQGNPLATMTPNISRIALPPQSAASAPMGKHTKRTANTDARRARATDGSVFPTSPVGPIPPAYDRQTRPNRGRASGFL